MRENKQTELELKYDWYYLNFINTPDPALFSYTNNKIDLTNPDLLMDKSEDALLKNDGKQSSGTKILPLKAKSSGVSIKSGFQEFDDFVTKTESKKTNKK